MANQQMFKKLFSFLIVIIAMSFFVKTSHAVKFPGFDIRGERRAETQKIHRNGSENTHDFKIVRTLPSLSVEKQLTSELLKRYDDVGRVGRPVINTNDVIHIKFGLSLIQIQGVDELNQILNLSLWYRLQWTDVLMRWTPSFHEDIQSVQLPSNSIWLPDIRLYNFADERLGARRDSLVIIQSNGTIKWTSQAILKSSCAFDIKYFPFDVQRCSLKFGSWTYSLNKLNIDFIASEAFELRDYVTNNEWRIIGNKASRKVENYTCCPDPFLDITYEIVLKRNTEFYILILILPCSLLAFLTLVIFWVPPESPAKLQLGVSVFLAFFVLLLALSEFVPRTASKLPIIGAYFCFNMVMITASTVLSCVVSNMYFRGIRTHRPPVWVRSVIGSRLAQLFGLDSKPLIFDEIIMNASSSNKSSMSDKVPVLLNEIDIPPNDDQDQNLNQQIQYALNNYDSLVNIDIDQGYQTPYLLLLEEVRAVRCLLDRTDLNSRQKDERNKVIREWQILASIADRIFFIVYVIINFITLLCIFTVL